ncbi:MAG: hypothetical protein RLZZ558_1193 [Planctomycetota bacterium]
MNVQHPIHALLAAAALASVGRPTHAARMQQADPGPATRLEALDATGAWTHPEATMADEPKVDAWPGWMAARWSGRSVEAPGSRSVMLLQDGQRVTGAFVNQPGPMRWRSGLLGTVDLDLERVRGIGPLDHRVQPGATQDRVLLVNGDHLEGFVEDISMDRGVRLHEVVNQDAGSWHALGAVKAIELAERPEDADHRAGWMVWLDDGSRVTMDTWRFEQDHVVLEGLRLPGMERTRQVARERVVAIARSDAAMRPLADLPVQVSLGETSGRLAAARVITPVGIWPLDLGPMRLCGPGRFEWTLPAGSWMLQATLVVPTEVRAVAGCTVRGLDGDQEMVRLEVNANFQPQVIRFPCRSGRASLEILTRDRSPVGGVVELRDALTHPMTGDAAGASGFRTSAPSAPDGRDGEDPR